jgi:hypothetical protein
MNLEQATEEVLTITSRPDRIEETYSAINWAISYCCLRSNFAFDLVESEIAIDPALYGATIQFNNLVSSPPVTRFRKFKYIKPRGVLKFLTPISTEQVFQPAGTIQKDRYYVAGNNLTYVLSAPSTALDIGYYQFPPVLEPIDESNTFWLLDMAPWVIIDMASARIFRSIGDDTSHRIYQEMGEELLKVARRDFQDAVLPTAR